MFPRAGNVGSDYRTAKSERFERRQVFRTEKRHVRKRKSAAIKRDQILLRHKTEKRGVYLQPRRKLPHIFFVPFITADKHDVQIDLMLALERRRC